MSSLGLPIRAGFTITEIAVVALVVVMLASMSVTMVVRIRDRSIQLGCLNQLRQFGMMDRTYSEEHGGRLALRSSALDRDLNVVAPGKFGVEAEIGVSYLCPRFYPARRPDGTLRPAGTRLNAADRRAVWASGTVGYALYRAAASGTGSWAATSGSEKIWAGQLRPGFGAMHENALVYHENQLNASAVRCGEFYASYLDGRDSTAEADAANTGWFHTQGLSSRPVGGNVICGDLSGRFSTTAVSAQSQALTLISN